MTALTEFVSSHRLNGTESVLLTTSAGRKHLVALFHALGFTRGAEIGVWHGQFAEQICQAMPGVSLLCVDPWKAYDDYADRKNNQARLDDAYRQTVARLRPYRCEIRRLSSTEAADQVPIGSLDFVYLDGNHAKSYVLADLEAWVPKVRSGGIVSGHDFEIAPRHAHLHVRDAVYDYARRHQVAPIYVLAHDKAPSFFWRVA